MADSIEKAKSYSISCFCFEMRKSMMRLRLRGWNDFIFMIDSVKMNR